MDVFRLLGLFPKDANSMLDPLPVGFFRGMEGLRGKSGTRSIRNARAVLVSRELC